MAVEQVVANPVSEQQREDAQQAAGAQRLEGALPQDAPWHMPFPTSQDCEARAEQGAAPASASCRSPSGGYDAAAVHYVSPTEDNRYQTQKMKTHGLFAQVHDEVGAIIVAKVDAGRIAQLLAEDGEALMALIRKDDKKAEEAGDQA